MIIITIMIFLLTEVTCVMCFSCCSSVQLFDSFGKEVKPSLVSGFLLRFANKYTHNFGLEAFLVWRALSTVWLRLSLLWPLYKTRLFCMLSDNVNGLLFVFSLIGLHWRFCTCAMKIVTHTEHIFYCHKPLALNRLS